MARPINADVQPDSKPSSSSASSSEDKRKLGKRRSVPAALKAVAGLFALAVVFLVAAIVGGGSGGSDEASGPAPATPATSEEPAPDSATAEELGFPAFATSNTTRVGGGDPVANAAAVALAVYPSTKPSQRPPAVALVDGADWRGGIAAAVLMAPPVGAPALISADGEVPAATMTAFDALDPAGGPQSGGARAFAIGAAAAPDGLEAQAVGSGGSSGAAAVARLRDRLHGRPPKHIVVAPAAEPLFAMPAAAWAARSGDPVLFSERDRLPRATASYLRRHKSIPVFVVAPSTAISSRAVRAIAAISKRVSRVAGEDPVANAVALARHSDGSFGWGINDPGHGFVVARAEQPLDAVAAAPLSASGTWGPLLLSDAADRLPAAVRDYLLDVKPGYTTDPTRAFYNHVWVIGDQDAIDVSQQAEIDELAELTQIGGKP